MKQFFDTVEQAAAFAWGLSAGKEFPEVSYGVHRGQPKLVEGQPVYEDRAMVVDGREESYKAQVFEADAEAEAGAPFVEYAASFEEAAKKLASSDYVAAYAKEVTAMEERAARRRAAQKAIEDAGYASADEALAAMLSKSSNGKNDD